MACDLAGDSPPLLQAAAAAAGPRRSGSSYDPLTPLRPSPSARLLPPRLAAVACAKFAAAACAVLLLGLGGCCLAGRGARGTGAAADGEPLPGLRGMLGRWAVFSHKAEAARLAAGPLSSPPASPPPPPALFCNASAALPAPAAEAEAAALNLTALQRRVCEQISPREDFPRWEGQNNCWEWTKKLGCHAPMGRLSWKDAQRRASQHLPHFVAGRLQPLSHPEVCEHYWPDGRDWGADIAEAERAAAGQWLRENVAVYVLNMPRDVARWQSVSARLRELRIDFHRLEGFDLSAPGAYAEAKRAGLIPRSFSFTKAQKAANTPYQDMGGIVGTVGCAAAHLRAMGQAATAAGSRKRPLALVIEDDTLLADEFAVKLRRMLEEEAPCDWSAISLKSKCPYGTCISRHLSRVLPDRNEPADRCRHGVNWGFYAMLYRVDGLRDLRDALAEVVWDDERPHCLDVDVALASISDRVAYYAVPNMQERGFLSEGAHGSSRIDKNREGLSTELQEEARAIPTSTRPSLKGFFKSMLFPEATTTTAPATTAPSTHASGEGEAGVEETEFGKEAIDDTWAEDFIDRGAGSPGRFAEAEAYALPAARQQNFG